MPRKKPAFEKAVSFLHEIIQTQLKNNSTRLPTIRELAESADVSFVTMAGAVRNLCDRKMISVAQRSGIHILGDKPCLIESIQQNSPPPDIVKWEWLTNAIRKDLYEGMFPSDNTFPLPKELAIRYGVCFRTLKKTLNVLVDEGILDRYKRTYIHRSFTPGNHFNTVVLVGIEPHFSNPVTLSPRRRQFMRVLENECVRRKINLKMWPYDYFDASGQPRPLGAVAKHDSIMGFLIWPANIPFSEVTNAIEGIRGTGQRAAILDETGNIEPEPWFSDRVAVIRIGIGETPGSEMGRYLLKKGHRNAAYISFFHDQPWSQNRFSGLVHSFESSGTDCNVRLVALSARKYSSTFLGRLWDTMKPLNTLIQMVDQENTGPTSPRRNSFSVLRNNLDRIADSSYRDDLYKELDKLLRHHEITVWVCVNDDTAYECLLFLKGRKIKVPEQISVIGFDDNEDSFYYELTSYNFNAPAVMNTMLSFIMDSKNIRGSRNKPGIIEIPGYFTERHSTHS
jgi:DNA-binding GntR family transcriptional regulator